MASARPAVLFDVDGTLIDSNYLHVYAWLRAFDAEGLRVDGWRIHRCIGMDGTTLMRTLAGDTGQDVLDRLKDRHSAFYKESAHLLAVLPGARDLLRRVADLGLQVVLATSAPEDELTMLREVLDCDAVVSEVTSSQDVDTAKPKPDIVQVALDRAGVSADEAVFVGDAVWDCEAAGRAHVPSIGVLSGGVSRGELREAGASDVFEDPGDLLAKLDTTRIGELARSLSG
ncbi:haloacid dehalogenase superfamily protein, subfamily IA, variant 3 with third motif having DD or ED [Mycolicibacterium chubuense NBB4]|uniref:Haloacid dehalogenase superfamily protein, subfamily IA, variant 3 with third motif having DD or ED n=1 Tax=Mycolicibacterium chubuense (strain NBB4) TaxID=710421 RepID=I4BGM6_MYCCN|nr:HAD family hydrolase [Mycolicibacterium chubuense]AFM16433.1 haloacid dehalogenase superfamily protein, subfamily IA, variant 3 with third motif having DD or ED [Mycolicibacterium chubuense NBB4]